MVEAGRCTPTSRACWRGGARSISKAGDDAFLAETKLVIDDGTGENVKACYEGYELRSLYINGGEHPYRGQRRRHQSGAAAADLGDGPVADDCGPMRRPARAPPTGSEGGTCPNGMEAPEGAPDGMTLRTGL